MREMKNSGYSWIGDIPSHWEVRKIKNYYDIQTGFTPDTKNELYYDDVEGYDWVNISDIQDGKTIFNTKKKISNVYIERFNPEIIPQGSLMYSFKLSVGQTAFAGKPIYSNEAIASFLPKDNINLNYLRYSSTFIVENAQTNIYNAKILNQDLIRNAYITFPPLVEQKKIADFLDEKCAEIYTVIEKTKATIEEYKKLKQSVITQAVTKGIRPNRPMKDSGIEWIGEIPADWKTIKAKWLLNERKERSINGDEEPLSMSQRLGLVPTKDMDMIPNMASSFVGAKLVYQGDLVFNKLKAHLGVFAVSKYEGLVSPDYAVYFSNDLVRVEYLEYLFKTPQYIAEFRKKSSGVGAGLTRLYTDDLFSIYCSLPSIEEQDEISTFISKKCCEIDELIAKKISLLSELESYKKSLIYVYVTGKKEVK